MFEHIAAEEGTEAAAKVAAGTITEAQAGDLWVAWADQSHAAGVAFERAYDRAMKVAAA